MMTESTAAVPAASTDSTKKKIKTKDKEKIKKRKQIRSRKKANTTFCAVFLVLMAVFCTSKFWMPDTSKTYSSAYGAKQASSQSIVMTLKKWEVNPITNYMEAAFDVQPQDTDVVLDQDLQFTPVLYSFDRGGNKDAQLTCKIAYKDNDTLVIQMPDVPSDWQVLGLAVRDNSDTLKSIQAASNPNDNTGWFGQSSDEHAVFYCDSRAAHYNTTLKAATTKDYAVDAIEAEIATTQGKIADFNTQIKRNQEAAASLQKAVDKIKNEQAYETESELEDSKSVLQTKQSQIQSLSDSNKDLQQKIALYQKKIAKLNVKLGDVYNGVTRTYEAPQTSSSDISAISSGADSAQSESSQSVQSAPSTASSVPSSASQSVPKGSTSSQIIYFDVPKSGT